MDQLKKKTKKHQSEIREQISIIQKELEKRSQKLCNDVAKQLESVEHEVRDASTKIYKEIQKLKDSEKEIKNSILRPVKSFEQVMHLFPCFV